MQLLSFVLLLNPSDSNKGGTPQLLLIVAFVIIFWLFMIRPQARKAKKQKVFVNQLEKGYRVVTMSGIHGRIHKVNEDSTLELEIAPGSYIKVEKSSISMEMSQAINKMQPPAKEAASLVNNTKTNVMEEKATKSKKITAKSKSSKKAYKK